MDAEFSLILRALGDAAIDCQMREESLDLRFAHFAGVNLPTSAVVLKPQKLLDPPPVGLDRARCQTSHLTRGFVLIKELHAAQVAAQELPGQFARSISTHPDGLIEVDTWMQSSILNAFC